MGRRYYCFTIITFLGCVCRFWRARDTSLGKAWIRRAVRVVYELARFNGKTSNLTLEQLLVAGGENLEDDEGSGSVTVCFGWGSSFKRAVCEEEGGIFNLFASSLVRVLCYLFWPFCGIMTFLQWPCMWGYILSIRDDHLAYHFEELLVSWHFASQSKRVPI